MGPIYRKREADRLSKEKGWSIAPDGEYFRRVVPSPEPKRIIEINVIKMLVDSGIVVICAGGGGIPTMYDPTKERTLIGVEAVIDKDYVASILATDLNADLFIVLTNVPMIAENYGRPNQKWLRSLPVDQARAMMEKNQFPPGSMGPKVQSAIDFVEATGKEVLITDADSLKMALERKAGTFIVADGDLEYAAIQ